MNCVEWYITVYYKYRQYPVKNLNATFKNNELKQIYAGIFHQLSSYFTINPKLNRIISSKLSMERSVSSTSEAPPRPDSSFNFITDPLIKRNQKLNDSHPEK